MHILDEFEPGIGIKGIVKAIEKESFSNSQFLISQTGKMNRNSRFVILRSRPTSISAAGVVVVVAVGDDLVDVAGHGGTSDVDVAKFDRYLASRHRRSRARE